MLTQSNSLADQNTTKNEDANLVVRGEGLNKGRNHCDEATKTHTNPSTKEISLFDCQYLLYVPGELYLQSVLLRTSQL
jgi:hypothetical protein